MAVEESKFSDRNRNSTPARCRPSITCSPQVSAGSGGAKVDRVSGRSLTAIIWLLNPASQPQRCHLSRAVFGLASGQLWSGRSGRLALDGWCHKRAFVTLGHNSLPSACPGVGHKGIVQ